jgi:hypothetical protein
MMKASLEHPAGLECEEGRTMCMEVTTKESNEERIKMKGRRIGEVQD